MTATCDKLDQVNIILVNNDSDTWSKLEIVVRAAGYDVAPIHHSAIGAIEADAYDAIILSGGWWYDDMHELLSVYDEELRLIRTTSTPILGICIGMQLMHVAVGKSVPLMDEPHSGDQRIIVNDNGRRLFGFPTELDVFKNHTRAVVKTDPQFEALAHSKGHVEIMRHTTRPLIGVQFHPEAGPVTAAAGRIKTLVGALFTREDVSPRVSQDARGS